MLTARIKIGSGSLKDTREYGLVYLDSDKRTAAPTKGFDTTSYPEEEGEYIIPRTVDSAFDYTVKFFIQATSLQNANGFINAFNEAVLPLNNSTGQREAQVVTFYNDYKRHKIVGYAQPIAEATEFWRDISNQVNDVVVVELAIRVTKPSLCDFNLTA